MNTPVDLREPWRTWLPRAALFAVTVSTLLVGASATQMFLLTASVGPPIPVENALGIGLRENFAALLFTPLVLWVYRCLPIDRTSRWKLAFAHLSAALVVTIGAAAVQSLSQDQVFFFDAKPLAEEFPRERREQPTPLNEIDRFRLSLFGRGIFQLLSYLVIAGLWHGLEMHRQARERARQAEGLARRLAEARLQALRMQLQPHFLFNTLNAIASQVRDQPEVAEDMIAHLGDFLRRTLEDPPSAKNPLRQELALLDHYLAIEQVRFGERLEVCRDISPEALDCLVPILLFQPLVENAVCHGVGPRRGPGKIRLHARCEAGRLHLAVIDNGRGLPAGQPLREGVGLANTRARLAELYGSAAHLSLRSSEGGGVTAAVELPLERPVGESANSRPRSRSTVMSA